jgi:hypothetical protein
MFASADRSRWWRPAGFVVSVLVASWSLSAPAQAADYGRHCERFLLSNNAEATVCAFVQSKHGRPGYRGVGTIAVDRGTATMEIEFVQLFRGDAEVQTAGDKKAEEAASLEQRTGWYTPDYDRYRVVMGYSVGIRGGGFRSATVTSDEHELRRPSPDEPGGPM